MLFRDKELKRLLYLWKAFVVYGSMYGNTEKVAEALSAGLESKGVNFDFVRVGEVKSDELVMVDLLCVGNPTHA